MKLKIPVPEHKIYGKQIEKDVEELYTKVMETLQKQNHSGLSYKLAIAYLISNLNEELYGK